MKNWICPVCGYQVESATKPAVCTVCGYEKMVEAKGPAAKSKKKK